MAHLLLAGLLMGKKDLDAAIYHYHYHYRYAIKLIPDNADALANLAQVYELLNQTENACDAINHALVIESDHVGALMALAKIEKRDKNYSLAQTALNTIINKAGQVSVKAMAYIELGHVLDKMKRFDEAFITSSEGKRLWPSEVINILFDRCEYQDKIDRNKAYFTEIDAEHNAMHNTVHVADVATPVYQRSRAR